MAVSIHNLDEEYVNELATIELAYHIFKEAKNSLHFNQLAEEIKKIKKINDDRLYDILSQLYTELNLDGRFLHLGKNEWALKSWYSVATADELLKVREIDEDEDDEDFEVDEDFVELLEEDPIIPAKSKKKKVYDLGDDTATDDLDVNENIDLEELNADDEEISDDDDMEGDLDEDLDADLDDLADEDMDYEDTDVDENADDEVYYIDEDMDKE